jgi:hypothetical protein
MEELLPEIVQRRFAQYGQGGKALFNRIRHRNLPSRTLTLPLREQSSEISA